MIPYKESKIIQVKIITHEEKFVENSCRKYIFLYDLIILFQIYVIELLYYSTFLHGYKDEKCKDIFKKCPLLLS